MMTNCITTFSGKHFDYQNPTVEMIDILDIARALSHECRFAGHIRDFYSVAQHSVECSFLVPAHLALEALLHDAAEAYCKDIPTPLKHVLPQYKMMEKRIDSLIRLRFDLPKIESIEIKKADLIMLATEKKSFKKDEHVSWPILDGIKPLDYNLEALAPNVAYRVFLNRFNALVRYTNVIH